MRRGRNKRQEFWARSAMEPTDVGRAAGEHAARARRWRRLVKANFVAFPFAVLALVMVTAQLVTTQAGGQQNATGDGVPTVVRAEAMHAVTQWLDSESPPLTDAHVAGWDGAQKQEWPDSTQEKDRTYEVWVARVLVSTDAGVYVAGVHVTVDANGAASAGAPSLEVVPLAGGPSAGGGRLWPGTSTVSVSDAVARAIQAWAEAYTSGDPTALTTVVADPDTAHAYLPISGFTSVTATVNTASYRAHGRGDDPDTSQLMVNVTLQVERDGLDRPARLGFDLLVTAPTTGAARVTAWGPSGSGPTLTPYCNAVSAMGGAVVEPSMTASSQAPSADTATTEEP